MDLRNTHIFTGSKRLASAQQSPEPIEKESSVKKREKKFRSSRHERSQQKIGLDRLSDVKQNKPSKTKKQKKKDHKPDIGVIDEEDLE